MSADRTRYEKAAVVIAAAALAWVVGATMFYRSGGVNGSGLMPTTGCSIALWGSFASDPRLMWFGTGIVTLSAALLVVSLGLVVVPAAVALALGSVVLKSGPTVQE